MLIYANPHKAVKHSQAIHRLLPTDCLSVFDHFMGLAIKGLNALISFDVSIANIHEVSYFQTLECVLTFKILQKILKIALVAIIWFTSQQVKWKF